MHVIESHESQVRTYVRHFPTLFHRAEGCYLYSSTGQRYIDFFAGAGALNYGHNHPRFKNALLEYISDNGITLSLDMATSAKAAFIESFHEKILIPRKLNYKFQFCGPTGANAVEAALKLAKKYTGRRTVIAFNLSYHGLSLGALSVTDSPKRWKAIGFSGQETIFLPYLQMSEEIEKYIQSVTELFNRLKDTNQLPAAIIIEMIQGEGSINTPSIGWVSTLKKLSEKYGILFIVDEIQTGCGRTKDFFAFEKEKIIPDIICLSKSLSGYGLPMSMLLVKPEIDIWESGEHSGTFRGNNLAFVTAYEATNLWTENEFLKRLEEQETFLHQSLNRLKSESHFEFSLRGRGFMWGLEWPNKNHAQKIAARCFELGLIVETVGPESHVLKLMPPIIINHACIEEALSILKESIENQKSE